MKILLIGGTSLIGPHLIKEIFSEGFEVATITRSGKNFLSEKTFLCDRNNEENYNRIQTRFYCGYDSF